MLVQARSAEAQFNAALPRVEGLVAASGPAQSESWIAAQLAFSELMRLRSPAIVVAADLDEMRASQAQSGNPALASELALVEAAAEELRAMDASEVELTSAGPVLRLDPAVFAARPVLDKADWTHPAEAAGQPEASPPVRG